MRTNTAPVQIVTIATATIEHPRHSDASIVELRDGSLMLAWQEFLTSPYAGEDGGPSQIVSAISHDGGLTWGDKRIIVPIDEGDISVFCPTLLRLQDGSILLSYVRYHCVEVQQDSSYYIHKSYDDGLTFSEPVAVWERTSWCPKSHAMKQLSCGRIVLANARLIANHSECAACYSDDNGATWTPSRNWIDLPLRGAMEPALEELKDGRLLMIMRTQLGALFQTISHDKGETWSLGQTTGLRSPEAPPEMIRIPQTGDLLMIWNNSEYDPGFGSHYGKRSPLTVAVSRDEGQTWGKPKDIETDPRKAFSDQACTVTSHGTAVITYFECPYTDDWLMNVELINLKAAIVQLDWLYSEEA